MTNLNKWIFGVSDFSSTEPLQNAEKIIASGNVQIKDEINNLIINADKIFYFKNFISHYS